MENREANLLSLINPSLEVYCSTTFANHCIIRFIRFVSRFLSGGCGMSFVSYPHLILLINNQIFEVTVAHENFWEKYCSNFQLKIRMTKYDLIVNLITWMDGKSRHESIKPN